jgi:hypothetical protein
MSSSPLDRSCSKIGQPFLALSYKTSSNFFHMPFIITIDIIHPNKKWWIFCYIYIYCAKKKTFNGQQIAKELNEK